MREVVHAYIINEARGPEVDPVDLMVRNGVVRFTVPVLQRADVQNRNGRTYDWDVLYEGANTPYILERLRSGTLYCEIGHPREQTIERQLHLDRERASCIVKRLEFHQPVISGVVETCATERGRDLMGLITVNKCKVAFSMRGIGKVVEQGGCLRVQRPLRIATWDEVVHPSVQDAYMGEIMTEDAKLARAERMVESAFPELVLINESEFARWVLDESDVAREAARVAGVDPAAASATISEAGELVVAKDGTSVHVLTESRLRREIDRALLARRRGGR